MLQRMASGRFLVLGRVGMDLYADPPGTRIEEAKRFVTALGGSAGNIAVALARMGAEAALLSRVSDDAVGRYCLAQLRGYGVGTDLVHLSAPGSRTSLAVTETRATGCQVVLYRNGAADFDLSVDDVAGLRMAGLAALVVTGTALAANPSRSATQSAMAQARAKGVPVVLDLDYRAYSWASPAEARAVCMQAADAADMLVGNDDEFALLAGGMAEGAALAAAFAVQDGKVAIYKQGAQGSVTHLQGRSFATPIFPVHALKPMGAGDAFLGGLLAALSQGHAIEQAVRRGSAAAAMVVAGIGCAPATPDLPALHAFITDQDAHAHRPL